MRRQTRVLIGILASVAALAEIWNVFHIICTRAGTPLLAPWLFGAGLGFITFVCLAFAMFRKPNQTTNRQ